MDFTKAYVFICLAGLIFGPVISVYSEDTLFQSIGAVVTVICCLVIGIKIGLYISKNKEDSQNKNGE